MNLSDKFRATYGDTTDFTASVLLDKLLESRKGLSTSGISFTYKCPKGHKNVAEAVAHLKPVSVFQLDTECAIAEFDDSNFVLVANSSGHNSDDMFLLRAYGDLKWLLKFKKKHEHNVEKKTVINWYYTSNNGGITSKEFEVDEPLPVYDEFYPYIKGGVDDYFERYFNSRASVLILIGEPGTGKTSLIRHILYKKTLKAVVTFDEKVMASESFYVNYSCSTDSNLLVVEDADLLLSSRQSDQNRLMNKLLNISDGLVRLDRKKVIFSTNLANVNKIDSALIRPGRCFDVLYFRPLTNAEGQAAAIRAGIELPESALQKKEMTLAEVFNSSKERDAIERFKLLKTAI